MRVTVVVPSYRRHKDLARCLAALRVQRRVPESVLVVLRDIDVESSELIDQLTADWPELRVVPVDRPGVVAAMNAGLDAASGDIVALTDDDAEPATDWLERLVQTFESSSAVAGVGGRDDQPRLTPTKSDVGRVQWFGRVIGNHHVGIGPARDVDVLKGVNCAFRLDALRTVRFDERLRGAGAQVHWELSLCLSLRRAGWRLVYDPAIRVRHLIGQRHDDDQLHRGQFDVAPHENAVFNETLALAEHFSPIQRSVFRVWYTLVGTAQSPGLLQVIRLLAGDGCSAWARWRATQRARSTAMRASR